MTPNKHTSNRLIDANRPSFQKSQFAESEVVIGFVGAMGVDLPAVEKLLADRLKTVGYEVETISITEQILKRFSKTNQRNETEARRITSMMDVGNSLRENSGDEGILARGVAHVIANRRNSKHKARAKTAYIVHSLKHPEEVRHLREIYPQGFYLIGVHASPARRLEFLTQDKSIPSNEAKKLMKRDMNEDVTHGQRVIDTFHLSDFFVRMGHGETLKKSLWRIVAILFGDPHKTPNFEEYAMFLAFSAALRSGDLSRQVGAVIAKGQEILATGANDCPKPHGGLYWPLFDAASNTFCDAKDGRDSARGIDSNKKEQTEIINSIAEDCKTKFGYDPDKIREALSASRIRHLTEFGRVVHAEMEALLSCARNGISVSGASLFCTTFPCHNCAKHIIAAGITRVVFVEPYEKSRAIHLHGEAIEIRYDEPSFQAPLAEPYKAGVKVVFEPFVGIGPRQFFNLFSMHIGTGYPLTRKDLNGKATEWRTENAKLRIQMLPKSYLELEADSSAIFEKQYPDFSL